MACSAKASSASSCCPANTNAVVRLFLNPDRPASPDFFIYGDHHARLLRTDRCAANHPGPRHDTARATAAWQNLAVRARKCRLALLSPTPSPPSLHPPPPPTPPHL